VETLIVEKSKEIITYKFQTTGKTVFFQNKVVNLEDYIFELKSNVLSSPQINRYAISKREKEVLLLDNAKGEFRKSDVNEINNFEPMILYLVMSEILANDSLKIRRTKSAKSDYSRGCSIENQYIILNTGTSRSVASEAGVEEVRLAESLSNMSGSSCTQMGSVDTSCGFGDHLCFSTSTWCCPNNDPPY
jgi:hypothetical protein